MKCYIFRVLYVISRHPLHLLLILEALGIIHTYIVYLRSIIGDISSVLGLTFLILRTRITKYRNVSRGMNRWFEKLFSLVSKGTGTSEDHSLVDTLRGKKQLKAGQELCFKMEYALMKQKTLTY
jgi:hypothetical protein